MRVRPLTILLVVVAIGFVALGVFYFVTPAHNLPALMPGHEAHSTHHHVKHGIAMIGLALLVLIGAWFTTAPERHST